MVESFVSAVEGKEEELLVESLRALRNLIAGVEENQISVAEKLLKRDGFDFWGFCAQDTTGSSLDVETRLCVSAQFMGNLVGNNLQIQQEYFEPLLTIIHLLLKRVDQRVALLACMPLLSLLKAAPYFNSNQQASLAASLPLLLALLQTAPYEGSDFLHLCIPALIESPHLFPLLSPLERASCLDLILPEEEDYMLGFNISPENILVLSHDFTMATDGLLTTNMITSLDQLHPTQVLKMTFIACALITETANGPGKAQIKHSKKNYGYSAFTSSPKSTSIPPWSFKCCCVLLVVTKAATRISPASTPIEGLLRGNLVPTHCPSSDLVADQMNSANDTIVVST